MDRKNRDLTEKKQPGLSFIVFVPVNYSLSTTKKVRDDFAFAVANNESKTPSAILRDWYLKKILKVNKEKDMFKNFPEVRSNFRDIKSILHAKSGVLNLSEEAEKFMTKYVKEVGESNA